MINSMMEEAKSTKIFLSEEPKDYMDILSLLDEGKAGGKDMHRAPSGQSKEQAKKPDNLNTSKLVASSKNTDTESSFKEQSSMMGGEAADKPKVEEEKLVILEDEPLPIGLMRPMKNIERIIIQNKLHKQQILYKD